MDEYHHYDAIGLAECVKSGKITPPELIELTIERINKVNPKINSITHTLFKQAREISKRPSTGLFAGVPFLLKDLLVTKSNVPSCYGSKYLNNYTSPYQTSLVERYEQAGLIILGKTNTPEFGLNPVTEPEQFGPCRNPWNLNYTSGGSSGGSAAAVAAGIVPMAHGVDCGGSIRIPASCCGVFGLKPSRGRTIIGPHRRRLTQGLEVEHVITRSVRDSAAMLDIGLANGMKQEYFCPPPKRPYLELIREPVKPLKIAYTAVPFLPAQVDSDCQTALLHAVELCKSLGHTLEEKNMFFDSKRILKNYIIVAASELAIEIELLNKQLKRTPKKWRA